jgi:metallophosphoesterase superfamily enzyme
MHRLPDSAAPVVELLHGVSAVAPGLVWLHDSRAIVAADVHFAYEDVIGAALPAWSTVELTALLLKSSQTLDAREIILLGDAIHGARMSDGAARAVREALTALRTKATLTIVAGNHEGKSRGAQILGETVEQIERDGWLLLHGDRAPDVAALSRVKGVIIGHLHPSLPLGGRVTAPAFLAGDRIIAAPALTPYSSGLNVFSDACLQALRPFNVASRRDVNVVAAAGGQLYPFGRLSALMQVLQ